MLGEDKSQIAVLRDLLQKGRDNTDALLKIFQELGEQAVLQKVYALEIKKMDAALTATAEQAKFAYRDNCLEITPLYTSTPAQEPTAEMIEAGAEVVERDHYRDTPWAETAVNVYKAMIAAKESK